MKIGVLTSSRADYGIYLPLLKEMRRQPWVEFKIIAFGTHLSSYHGHTIDQIRQDGFEVAHTVESMPLSDSPQSISMAIGLTIVQFSSFWKEHGNTFDLVLCIGDRYEMFAAVMAGVPLQIKFAHIHGGETTLGAIDNIFRHSITQASWIHFASTTTYVDRIRQLLDSPQHVYMVGALSLDNLSEIKLLNRDEFLSRWGIDLSLPTVLTTFHPETVSPGRNRDLTLQLVEAIETLKGYQFLITMPNADTEGSIVRQIFKERLGNRDGVVLVENLGTQSYFSAMSLCAFLLGNTSSGIIEAASFSKYVINIGDRQKGRQCGANVIHVPIDKESIVAAVRKIERSPALNGQNIYYNGGAAKAILNAIRDIYTK